jgi:hypothetical protein
MILLTSDNIGLSIGFWFGLILSVLVILGTVGAIGIAIKPKEGDNRVNYIVGSIFGIIISCYVVRLPYTEYNLLINYIWVDGTVIGRCTGTDGHQDYKFEYYIGNKGYTNCNSSGDVDSIQVPGARYKVRVSKAVPDIGRIDFTQPIILQTDDK